MSIDLDQVLYARARWRKTILVPLWTFQIMVLLCLMGIFAYRLAETFEHYREQQKMGQVPMVEVVWEATNVGFNLISLVLNFIEIARKATERLTPFLMLCTHVIKLTLAFAVLALDIVAYLQRMDGHYSTIGLSLDCGLLAATLATFVYTLTTYRRLLKYETYHLTANGAPQQLGGRGGHGGGVELTLGHKHSISNPVPRVSVTAVTTQFYNREYDTAYPSQTMTTRHDPVYQSPPATATTTTTTTTTALKTEIDRAIGNEFGWGSRSVSNASSGAAKAALGRTGSVVLGSGKVPVHHGMTAVPELHRAHSWRVEEEGAEDNGVGGDGGGGGSGPPNVRDGEAGEEDREALLPGK
ncbi:Transmembrane protein [Madurella fahalii]|uniref:Transmembrane protein n=1 Tax=Madurella fahalii TaxID=1157608 RepID=A0ABQ0GIL2_9PEZI